MSDPLPPSEAEQRARSAYAASVERGNMPSPWIAKSAFDECARLRALLGEVCGAAMVLRAGMLPCDRWTDEQREAVETIDRAVKRARSTP